MSQATELIAKQMAAGSANARVWADILYNVKLYGAKGNGTTDDTASVQATIDAAIAAGGKAVFFPHGTYKVTALTNVSSVILFGDNAVFSGINNTITQIGAPVTSGIVYNVKDYGAKGDGTTIDTTKITDAITAATALGGIVFFPPGTYKISAAFTVPSNVTLWFANGAKLSVDTGITVTINGPIEAGLHQIFSGLGIIAGNPTVAELYPEWWGAVRDGVTDDSAAINAALEVIQTSGGRVKLSPGTYKASEIHIYGNNLALVGSGMGVTKLLNSSTTADCIDLSDAWQKLQITISDMTIQASTSSTGCGINSVNVNRSVIERVQIKGHLYNFFYGDKCFDVFCNAMNILQPATNGSAIRVVAGTMGGGLYVSNSTIECNSVSGSFGIDIVSGSGCYFNQIDIRNAGIDGVIIRPNTGDVTLYHFFTNVLGDTAGRNGINIDPSGTGVVYGITFVDCWGSTCAAHGVAIDSEGTIDGVEFIGQRCFDNGQNGMIITGGTNISVQGGTFAGNSKTTVDTYCGIIVSAGVSGFKIQNARCGSAAGRGTGQAIGIAIATGASNNYMIMGNDLRGNAFAGVDDKGTGVNKVVANNLS